MNGEPIKPQVKPVRREKEPKRLRQVSVKRAARIAAGEPAMSRSRLKPKQYGTRRKPPRRSLTAEFAHPKPQRAKGTAHSRRPREFGKMFFLRTLPCRVREVWLSVVLNAGHNRDGLPEPPRCDSIIEVMHLGSKRKRGGWRRADDSETARGCRVHHRGIDGTVGGRGPWYVALGEDGQTELRRRLVALNDAEWLALTPESRALWDEEARRQIAGLKSARRSA